MSEQPTDIVKPDLTKLPSLVPSDEEMSQLSILDRPFVPAMKLLQGLSGEIESSDNAAGDFYISSDQHNLGKKVKIVVVQRRPHALLLENNVKVKESFDMNSPVFKEIAFTQTNRPKGIVSFAAEGDWLFYLPEYNKFVTYFCGQRSNRPLTTELVGYLKGKEQRKTELERERPQTNHFELYSIFETKMWGNKNKSWRPKVTPLEPFDPNTINPQLLKQALALFVLPMTQEVEYEVVEDDDGIDR